MPQLTLIITLNRTDEMIQDWVRTLANSPAIEAFPLIIAYPADKSHLVPELHALLNPVASIELEEPDRANPAQTHLQALSSVNTRYAAIVPVPRHAETALPFLLTNLQEQLEWVAGVTQDLDVAPILVPTTQRQRVWFRSYMAEHAHEFALAPAYYGALAIRAGSHTLEAIDPVGDGSGGLLLHGRLSLGRYNLSEKPPWSVSIALTDNEGQILTVAPASVSRRVDSHGVYRWENLTATLDISNVPEGNHNVQILLDDAPQMTAHMAPTPGLLANARTRTVKGRTNSTIYLAHTTGTGRLTWMTVYQSSSTTIARAWERILVRKDLRTFFLDQSAGRLRIARIARLLTLPLFRRKNIWLLGEREDTAQDNGMHLFRHLRNTHPDREVYYILDRKSPHWHRVADLGNVIAHSSLRHRLLMLHASVIANAYSIKHIVPRQWHPNSYTRHLAWRVGALRVYLKHGVHMATNAVKRGAGGYDLYLTVSAQETTAFRRDSGYDEQLVETGLPRYDALTPTPPSRTILFMPTWRRYLVPKLFGDEDAALVPFHGSTYEDFLVRFLSSPKLHSILEHHDFTLQFLPHYNVQELLGDLPVAHPRISFADTSAQGFTELLTGCDVFITDYSSVHFDVAYVGTPIIYTHFDYEEYLAGHATPSWFDHERDGFGPVTTTLEQTLRELEAMLARGATLEPQFAERAERAFTHHDNRNCERVTEAVDELVSTYNRERVEGT